MKLEDIKYLNHSMSKSECTRSKFICDGRIDVILKEREVNRRERERKREKEREAREKREEEREEFKTYMVSVILSNPPVEFITQNSWEILLKGNFVT